MPIYVLVLGASPLPKRFRPVAAEATVLSDRLGKALATVPMRPLSGVILDVEKTGQDYSSTQQFFSCRTSLGFGRRLNDC